MNEQIKEEIKFYTEWIKLLTIIMLANITGTLSLATRGNLDSLALFLSIIGIFGTYTLIWGIIILSYKVYLIIKRI